MAPGSENKTIFNKVRNGWLSLPRSRRLALLALLAVLLLAGGLASLYFGRTRYETLFRGLQPAEASAVITELQEQGITYRIEDGGTAILVPQDQVYELRFKFMGENPQFGGGDGFALFDNNSFGSSDFERQVKYQRALQEELQRTITSLDCVSQARVHLVLPEPSVFVRETAEPSAAIYIRSNPLSPVTEQHVRGIVNLVAGSVENLKPENITIIDSSGAILYDFLEDEQLHFASSGQLKQQIEIRREFEKELEKQVTMMLERVFGSGRAIATVSADLDFDTLERTVITYDEHEPVARSHQIIEENRDEEGAAEAEVGESNYPGYASVLPGGESSYEYREETENYEVGERVEHRIVAPGTIRRLSTAVVIDDGELTQGEIERVNELVASAIGFVPERGDVISVQGMPFDTSQQEAMENELAQLEERERQERFYRYALLVGIALLGLIIFFFWRRRQQPADEPALAAEKADERMIPELEQIMIEPEIPPRDEKRQRVKVIAEKDPEAAVYLLRTWLSED
ncbi:MAG: flagellar basal-body MS-ring/collar protein FliF [Dethiobacteria bacterium]